jgi:hypothetical protein
MAKSGKVELWCAALTSYNFGNRFVVVYHSIVSCISRFRVSSNRLCICLMQKQMFDKVQDSLEVVINEMQSVLN